MSFYKNHPFDVVKMFEENLSSFTGAPYVVTVDSCTNAIQLCCEYFQVKDVTIPARTYISVPGAISNAGGIVKFKDFQWNGIYKLEPYPIYDAAKRFTKEMYIPSTFMCLSFHFKKHLKIGKGGAILCDNKHAFNWFRNKRYEGRNEFVQLKYDNPEFLGHNFYMTPEQAARGMTLLLDINDENEDLEEDYPDLREFKAFK